MKIGYPCINNSIPRNAPSTFRLASYSENRLVQTIKNNLIHLMRMAIQKAMSTWKMSYDGFSIVDYSSQNKVNGGKNKGRRGKHTESIDLKSFVRFLKVTQDLDFDIMLEIKDKEKSALKALELITKNRYFAPIDYGCSFIK